VWRQTPNRGIIFPLLEMIKLLWHWLVSLVKSRRRLEAENLLLRHQLNILRRKAPQRLRLSNTDQLAFAWLCRLFPAVADAVTVIRLETLIRWHRPALLPGASRSRPAPTLALRGNSSSEC